MLLQINIGGNKMATYEYNGKIKFMLPVGFILSRDENDEGDEIVSILSGEYENDDGEICYKFSCRVNLNEYDPEEMDEDVNSSNLLEKLAERMEDSRRLKIPGKPETILINKGMPISFLGHMMKMFAFIGLIRFSNWSVIQLVASSSFNDDDPSENALLYENIFEVLKAIRVNGKKLPLEGLSPQSIQDVLELSFDEDGEAIDVSPKLRINITTDDRTRTYEYTADGMKLVDAEDDENQDFFFAEDSEINVDFEWPDKEDDEDWEENDEDKIPSWRDGVESPWMKEYGKYVEKEPIIDFNGTLFVFSGLSDHWAEKNHPIVEKVIKKGGQYRSKVSGRTDYLVVDPWYAGDSKIVAVMEQLEKGNNVKVILLEDLKNALEDKVLSPKSHAPAKQATKKQTPSGKTTQKKLAKINVTEADYEIESDGTLVEYTGRVKDVVLPNSITRIGEFAFSTVDHLSSIVIPEGVKIIEDSAFECCQNLVNVVFPSTIRVIKKDAFRSCDKINSIVIPDGCEVIGGDCFFDCVNLNDVYVPSSVYDIGECAFDTMNDSTTIHTPCGSFAESYAEKIGLMVDNEVAPYLSGKPTNVAFEDDIISQITEKEQPLSVEQQASLNEIKNIVKELGEDLVEGEKELSKFGDYLEQKAARKKTEEEKKIRKKAKAMAEGKSEKDIVNMFVILTNEKKLGHLNRNQDEFFEIYEEDFAAFSKAEVIKLRKDMLAEMEDDSLCSYYAESFKQRTVEDRFCVSTMNLNNVSEGSHLGEIAEWAIENTKEWYVLDEYEEVRRLMNAELDDTRNQISDNFKIVDENWMKFSASADSLQLVITNEPNATLNQSDFSDFQIEVESQFVTVRLSNKSLVRISTVIGNYMPWYWGVTIRDIWEAAFKNDVRDEREGKTNGNQLANKAISQIRSKYPDVKVAAVSRSNQSETPSLVTKRAASGKSVPQNAPPIQQNEPAKKEGCYIATAVYGSYNAPEVLILRRFRDEVLKNSVLGRWFVCAYYRFSPPIAKRLKYAKRINKLVRFLLDRYVERLIKKHR